MTEVKGMYSTWATVDLAVIRKNVSFFLAHTGVQVMAVVKANAYGHGAVAVARAALQAGATWCAVARVNEALELRQAGLTCPILILGYTPEARYSDMISQQVAMTAWNLGQIKGISAAAVQLNKAARLHVKVDTGMSRLGLQPDEAIGLLQAAARLPHLQVEGLFTHFARADEADPAPTDRQVGLFDQLLNSLQAAGIQVPMIHAANSAASLTRPGVEFHCVRLGIAMYGLHPSVDCPLPAEVRPALQWKSVLSQVKTLAPGRGISYGHEYQTRRTERIGTIPVGYADGFRRLAGNQVLVAGRKVPLVGRVTMDQVMVQLDEVADAREGDEVVLLGEQGGSQISAEEIAARWGTINYEVTSGIDHRVPRSY